MVAQLLAHIDTLDIALRNLSERNGRPHPTRRIIELLCTVPGVEDAAARPDRRMRPGPDVVPNRRALRILGRRVPGTPPVSRPSAGAGRTRPGPLARRPADRMREGGGPQRTPTSPLTTHSSAAARRAKAIGAIRHDLLVAYLPSSATRSPIGTSDRTATQAVLRRAPRPPPTAPTRSARLRRRPRAKSNHRPQSKPPNPSNQTGRATADRPPARTSTAQTWSQLGDSQDSLMACATRHGSARSCANCRAMQVRSHGRSPGSPPHPPPGARRKNPTRPTTPKGVAIVLRGRLGRPGGVNGGT